MSALEQTGSSDTRLKHARGGVAMAIATFAMAGSSGIQALLYLSAFGVSGQTDGFFAAFAPYAAFGVFSQSIRVTSVPLLVGAAPPLTNATLARGLGLIALPVALATIVFSDPLSSLLAPGLSAGDRAVTADALPMLGGAMILQLFAAGAATVLAVRDIFRAIAAAYVGGAGAGLATYLAVSGATGELALAWSMLAMAIVTFLMMIGAVLFDGAPDKEQATAAPRPTASQGVVRAAVLILGRTFVYLVLNSLYLITLAFVSNYASGDATVLSYAYLFSSYLVAGTGFALGMSRIADMRRGSPEARSRAARETVPPGFRYSMLLIAGALGLFIAAIAPAVGAVLPHAFSADDVETLRTFAALLSVWTVAALLVNLLLPVMFALGRGRFVNFLAPALAALYVAATALGGAIFGVNGVVGAAFVAPAVFVCVLLEASAGAETRGLALEIGRDALRFTLPALVAFGLGGAAGALTGGGELGSAVVAGVVGTTLYVTLTRIAAPRQTAVLAAGLRPLGATPDASTSN